MDDSNVQGSVVSEDTSQTTEGVNASEDTSQVVAGEAGVEKTPEQLQQEAIAQATEQRVAEARKNWERETQSKVDKAIAETNKKAAQQQQGLQNRLQTHRQRIQEVDPVVAAELQQADLVAENQQLRQQLGQEAGMSQLREFMVTFQSNMEKHLTKIGVDSNEVNWGDVTEPLLTKQGRILEEAMSIVEKKQKTSEKRKNTEAESLALKERRESGTDRHQQVIPSGNKDFAAVRDAYIKNPNDPNVYRAYVEARRARGY